METLLGVLIGVAFLFVLFVCCYYWYLYCCVDHDDIYMTYEHFVVFFDVSKKDFEASFMCISYSGYDRFYFIYFKNIFDWLRARTLVKRSSRRINKEKKNKTRTETTLRFINDIKLKIDANGGK